MTLLGSDETSQTKKNMTRCFKPGTEYAESEKNVLLRFFWKEVFGGFNMLFKKSPWWSPIVRKFNQFEVGNFPHGYQSFSTICRWLFGVSTSWYRSLLSPTKPRLPNSTDPDPAVDDFSCTCWENKLVSYIDEISGWAFLTIYLNLKPPSSYCWGASENYVHHLGDSK